MVNKIFEIFVILFSVFVKTLLKIEKFRQSEKALS